VNSKSQKQSSSPKRKTKFINLIFLFLGLSAPLAALAGQNWQLTIVNNNTQTAYYQGFADESCWYPLDLGNNFTIAPNSSHVVSTEEKWAIFSGCGGAKSNITLNFTVFGANGGAVVKTQLVDTSEQAPPGSNSVTCSDNGYGEPTAMGWQMLPAKQGVTPQLSCGKGGSSSTVNATIVLPTF